MMTEGPLLPDWRRPRLDALLQEYGLASGNTASPLSRRSPLPHFKTPADEAAAEEILRLQRHVAQNQNSGSLRKAFTSKKKPWEAKEVYQALVTQINNRGNPGVVESLIEKLEQAGGSVNAQRARPGLLHRRRSMDVTSHREVLLLKAVENDQLDMVQVLVPHADTEALNLSLPTAIRRGNLQIVESMLQYGAGIESTEEARIAFRHACAAGGQHELVEVMVSSPGKPSGKWLNRGLIDAVSVGCLPTVRTLLDCGADPCTDNVAALKLAIRLKRRDLLLILLATQLPLVQSGLNDAFSCMFALDDASADEKLAMAEMLLLAGAGGDSVADVLVHSAKDNNLPMVRMLLVFGASIEYHNALALKESIERGDFTMAQTLLSSQSPLSPALASSMVALIPRPPPRPNRSPASEVDHDEQAHQALLRDGRLLLESLLRRGAGGHCLDEALISAVENRDIESARLLLSPTFPSCSAPSSPTGESTDQNLPQPTHEVASVDHKSGHALLLAVKDSNTVMVKLLLSVNPSQETLQAAFPATQASPSFHVKYELAQMFLMAGVTGHVINETLQRMLAVGRHERDERLVALFLAYQPDINFNGGTYVATAVSMQDINLLNTLLQKKPAPELVAKSLPLAMDIRSTNVRIHVTKLLLAAGASSVPALVSESLLKVLEPGPVDDNLVAVLLQIGKADINYNDGKAVVQAIKSHPPKLLDILLRYSHAVPATFTAGFAALASIPANSSKKLKLQYLLSRFPPGAPRDALSNLAVHEVQDALKTPPENRSFTLVRMLLAAGASVDMQNAAALQAAVKHTEQSLLDMMFTVSPNKPKPESLGHALGPAMQIPDPMDRLVFTRRLISEGAPSSNVGEALSLAITKYPDDISLIATLVGRADLSDGRALDTAIQAQNVVAVELILARNDWARDTLETHFRTAALGADKQKRLQICQKLLAAGVRGDVVGNALVTAGEEGDAQFTGMLMKHGANVDHQSGQAIIAACRSGAVSVLTALLGNSTTTVAQSTLARGFQAATELRDHKVKENILRLLLDRGIGGKIVDAQLVAAVKLGPLGIAMLQLLLSRGASVDYNSGEALWQAVQGGNLQALELLLGVQPIVNDQKLPSEQSRLRALKASLKLTGSERRSAVTLLFQAGVPVNQEVHAMLDTLVQEVSPDDVLIQVFLDIGASPQSQDCQAIASAARRMLPQILAMFLNHGAPKQDVSRIFAGVFTKEFVSTWFSPAGLEVARLLIASGANGDDSAAAVLSLVLDMSATHDNVLATQFTDLVLDSGVDVNYKNGLVLQKATARGNGELVQRILSKGRPNSQSISASVPLIFGLDLPEEQALGLIRLFTDHHVNGGVVDTTIDSATQPLLFDALTVYPRSTHILQALLDTGYYHDQATTQKIYPDVEPENVSLLLWTLLQPQKRISDGVILTLIERGANPNFTSNLSHTTPLMIAVKTSRKDIVKELLIAGADATAQDAYGNTPLTVASSVGSESGKAIMRMILKMEPALNDGSLHTAAARLDLETLRMLLDAGHEPDFPSPLHEGRSALAEVVLYAAGDGLTPDREKVMEKVILALLKAGSDTTIQSDGLSVLLLSLISPQALVTTRILLKCGLWKEVNSPAHQFRDSDYVYSPTQYVSRVLYPDPMHPNREPLLRLLRHNRAVDVYYAHSPSPACPQPPDAVGLPPELDREERTRKYRLSRIALEEEDHAIALRRTVELAQAQSQLWQKQADLEDARASTRRRLELESAQEQVRAQQELFEAEAAREQSRRTSKLLHETQLLASEESRRRKLLEWTEKEAETRVDTEKKLSALRLREREELERLERKSDERAKGRFAEHRKLVESQTKLAGKLGSAGINGTGKRQIGWIGEVD